MKNNIVHFMQRISIAVACVIILYGLSVYAGHVQDSVSSGGPERLEEAVRRAAVACYSTEGCYPPDLKYLEEHYGLKPDPRYTVHYNVFAENVPPEIVVTWR